MAARKAFLLRIDPDLWNQIEGWAAAELRSVNGQIEFILREAVRKRRGGDGAKTAAPPPPAGESDS